MDSTPFSDDAIPVRLHLTAGSPLAELFLIDHSFDLVERSIGELNTEVEQGVYKVKARLGQAIVERLIVLNHDQSVDLSDELAMGSPVPLTGTTTTHEFHAYPARDESHNVKLSAGSGAQVFLCSRRWTSAEPTRSADLPPSPPQLSLHRRDGEMIVDVLESGAGDRSWHDAMLSATIEVDSGPYLLRWSDEFDSTAEQTVTTIREWQTQAFLLEDARDESNRRYSVSLLMSRDGFEPDDTMTRLAEEARAALADERKVTSGFINESLFAKFDSPMLGLFGAHLMLLGRDAARKEHGETQRRDAPVSFDQPLFDDAVANLISLLGRDQPDVTALATQASNQLLDQLEPVTVPPMLWRSWLLLIEASNDRPDLLPIETWQHVIRLRPLRPFLVWSPAESETVETWQRDAAQMVLASVPAGEPTVDATTDVTPRLAGDMAPDDPGNDPRYRLTQQLLAPRAAIDELAGGQPV